MIGPDCDPSFEGPSRTSSSLMSRSATLIPLSVSSRKWTFPRPVGSMDSRPSERSVSMSSRVWALRVTLWQMSDLRHRGWSRTYSRMSAQLADPRMAPTRVSSCGSQNVVGGMWAPGPLTPGTRLLFRFLVSCALSTREQMYSFVRVIRCVQPFLCVRVRCLQLLISLMATMIAMTTIRTTRTIRR